MHYLVNGPGPLSLWGLAECDRRNRANLIKPRTLHVPPAFLVLPLFAWPLPISKSRLFGPLRAYLPLTAEHRNHDRGQHESKGWHGMKKSAGIESATIQLCQLILEGGSVVPCRRKTANSME